MIEVVTHRRTCALVLLLLGLITAVVACVRRMSGNQVSRECRSFATTTTGLLALLEWPDEMERLRAEPSLAGDAVEELMRYTGPTGMMVRRARDDVEMRGKTMRAGDHVFLGVAAANHDPARFADPDRLDITRADKSHLGFGFGIHHCLGAPLARLEVEVTLTRLLERSRDIRLGEQPAWSSSVMGRSLQRLIVDVA